MYTYKTKALCIGEVWLDEVPKDLKGVDLVFYNQRPSPVEGLDHEDFSTMVINLELDEEDLLKQIHKKDRYQIRRAAQDPVEYQFFQATDISPALIDQFVDNYSEFAQAMGLDPVRRNMLQSYADNYSLFLSKVQTEDGTPLVWHSYLRSGDYVIQRHSIALRNQNTDNKVMGRANRSSHWKDMLNFKQLGIKVFDFGGWYAGDTDEKKLKINQFKERFGGEVVHQFKVTQPVSLKGKLYRQIFKV